MTQKLSYQNKSKDFVAVTSLQSNTVNNTLNIRADVVNNSTQNVHLYYRVVWRNEQGQSLSTDSWKPTLLLPQKSAVINAKSPLSTATDFTLELKAD